MDVEKVFHMNGGVDETSYARNSSLQKGAADLAKNIVMETLQEVYLNKNPESLGIAELGCSSGHNSLAIIKEMVNNIEKTCHKISKPVPEFRINLNDLITNDFNVLFLALPDFHKDLRKEKVDGAPFICTAAYPGSFYGRLFPKKSLHFVHTSYSLHWLSRVPPGIFDEQGRSINKTAILISESSPPQVSEAYYKQFQEDMSLFLRSRAEEVVGGGKMVLIFMGRIGANHVHRGNYLLYELLAQSFAILVSQGEVEAEKLESYNVHFYKPSKEEIENEVRKEGSFEIKRLEMLVVQHKKIPEGMSYGKAIASTIRAVGESALKRHFGDKVMDTLFENYARLIDEEKSKGEIEEILAVVVLEKKI